MKLFTEYMNSLTNNTLPLFLQVADELVKELDEQEQKSGNELVSICMCLCFVLPTVPSIQILLYILY